MNQFPVEGNPFKVTRPKGFEQLGWTIDPIIGLDGITGAAWTVAGAKADVQELLSLTVKL